MKDMTEVMNEAMERILPSEAADSLMAHTESLKRKDRELNTRLTAEAIDAISCLAEVIRWQRICRPDAERALKHCTAVLSLAQQIDPE